MTEQTNASRYKFEFSGDFVDSVIAPIPRDKAEAWLSRTGEALFKEVLGGDEEPDESDSAYLGRASDIPGATHLEGCELRHGSLEITDSTGRTTGSFSLEDEEFRETYVDDLQEIDLETHLLDGGPTLITRTTYTGTATYEPETPAASLEDASWYVIVTDMGGEPFVSAFNYEGEDVAPKATGLYSSQEVRLLVPDGKGNIRQLHYLATSGSI